MKENSNVTDTNVGDIEEAKRIIERLISTMKSDREMFDEKTREKEIYTFFINALEFILSDYKRVLKENEHKTEKIENQKSELAILNDKQKDFNKLQNTLKSYKGQFRRQEKENEKINSLIKKLKEDSKEQQWLQTADDEYLASSDKAMYADELLSFLRGEE